MVLEEAAAITLLVRQDKPCDFDPLALWHVGSAPVDDVMYHVTLPAAHLGLAMAVEVSSYNLC